MARLKYYNETSQQWEYADMGSGDTLPIGSIIEYDGDIIPSGYEQINENNYIDSGSNENGSWIKFADGTMIEYTKIVRDDVTIDTPEGVLYKNGGYPLNYNYPIPFINMPTLFFQYKPGRASWFTGYVYTETGISIISLMAGIIQTNINAEFNIMAIGKWK